MAASVKGPAVRTQSNPLHSDSHASGRRAATLDDIRAGSHLARITVNSVSRAAVREALRVTETSQKQFALTADVPESVVSDALNERGRNLESDWIFAQAEPFVRAFLESVERQLGLRPEQQAEVDEQRMVELFRLLIRTRRPA